MSAHLSVILWRNCRGAYVGVFMRFLAHLSGSFVGALLSEALLTGHLKIHLRSILPSTAIKPTRSIDSILLLPQSFTTTSHNSSQVPQPNHISHCTSSLE